jgi:glycosyltransferase involved in cell wall biosynthesis
VDDGVVFTGIREDVPELLHLFDIFVLPSLWEGQPITIMEAMAAGKPVVATSVGGNAEILRQGDLGVLVPARDPGALSDAIERLLKDRAMARQLGERARSHAASDLTSAVMTRRHEQIFESLFSY